ncbi:MAG TPA: hypothetical protein VHW65_09945 [Gemmatimonadales bacterium]|nr:hypothetical protein [Gemmatimonadales bacterium]
MIAWTVVFFAAIAAIIARERNGLALSARIATLDDSIRALDGTRSALEASVAHLKSRDLLSAELKVRGLRSATDSEVTRLRLPSHP